MPLSSDVIAAKCILPTSLDSETLRRTLANKILQQSLFSAQMAVQPYLNALKKILIAYAAGHINLADARLQCINKLEALGFDISGHALTDPSATRRLNLILKTNRAIAHSQALLTLQSSTITEAWPAWKLERYGSRAAPRADWIQRWHDAGASVNWIGAHHTQFVALKSSPIWQALGNGVGGYTDTLGNPFPPFAFSSGLSWTDVTRKNAIKLGLLSDEPDN